MKMSGPRSQCFWFGSRLVPFATNTNIINSLFLRRKRKLAASGKDMVWEATLVKDRLGIDAIPISLPPGEDLSRFVVYVPKINTGSMVKTTPSPLVDGTIKGYKCAHW